MAAAPKGSEDASTGRRLALLAGAVATGAVLLALVGGSAFGASIASASFSGGAGTVSVGGTLYAKNGGTLTLTVNTTDSTKCIDISGAHTGHQQSSSAQSSWTFNFTAGSGNGARSVNILVGSNFNNNDVCTMRTATGTASYILDNTPPSVTATLSPPANGAGWNNANVTINWSATDAGSGVAGAPSPASDSLAVNTTTAGVTKTSSATDRLGNSGSGSVTVKLDKDSPSLNVSRSPAANADGWNNTDVVLGITCSDALSGIKSCTGSGTYTFAGEGANQSVNASAVDNADNSTVQAVGGVNIDKTAPSLSGAPVGSPNGAGWYSGNVTIHWECADALSGISGSCPADSTISSEGTGLTATASVLDKAGNSTSATSAPAVQIDSTAPTTDATAPPAWNNTDVSVTLDGHDNLSGVAATYYTIDGGPQQTYSFLSKPSFTVDGVYALEYWSEDNAGNREPHKSIQVKIDKTTPTIGHTLSPVPNANGWNNSDVTIDFVCSDAMSGIASCGPDAVVAEEGAAQQVLGTALDNAGNTATDPATVSLDETPPTIQASTDRAPNANSWYDGAVVVSFECADALAGVIACPGAQTLGEGANQSASGSATDAAGNSASDGVSGINVDETAPSISGAATSQPNANGWYSADVSVVWSCSDALSGLDGDCPAESTISGEGGNRSASASVSDKAGNSANATVEQIRIDRTPPSTSADVPAPLESGWYAGDVLVTLNTAPDLSGVEQTYYEVDGGEAHEYSGPFSHGLKGAHTIRFWSVDRAGNLEDRDADSHSITLMIDGVPPAISGSRVPPANEFGWNNTPVSALFECSDAESGIAGCSDPVDLVNEGAGQSAQGIALDNAGNFSETTVGGINIDLTAPSLVGVPTTDANAAGWYRDDVTIQWNAADGLSGIDPATQPANSVISGEGSSLGAGPVTVADKAANSTSASVSGVKIDRTAPVISGAPTTSPNAYGWYAGDVVVAFSCTDNLSGVASCPSDKLVSGNGVDLGVTSDPATDYAGNTSAGKGVGGINIDGLPPQTVADNQCTRTNGYCTGSSATVVLASTDQPGLSGVKEIHYRVNGGADQVAAGASTSISVPLDGSGEATVAFFAVDKAGNAELLNGVSLKYDNIAPTVTHTITPAPNADEWNNSDATVHFEARDDDGGSGVDAGTVTPDTLVSDEPGRDVLGQAFDIAGNRGADLVKVKLDKTAPAISGAVVSGQLGSNGWFVGPVTVHFTCSDGLSGIAVCPDDVVLTANGANQSVSRDAFDKAGNRRSATVSGIDIDQEQPRITVSGVAGGGIYTLGAVPAASCSASDDFSGAASCSVQVSGGLPNGVGEFSYIATATDNAGNSSTASGSYRVVYRSDGFLQPINDTAHQTGVATSIFKAGSTVPVKFQLKRANGTVVQANSLPLWLTPARGSATTAAVDESLYGDAATSGTTYRWDSGGQQYIYNWGTAKSQSNYYWRVGVALDDGQTYYVNIGLR